VTTELTPTKSMRVPSTVITGMKDEGDIGKR